MKLKRYFLTSELVFLTSELGNLSVSPNANITPDAPYAICVWFSCTASALPCQFATLDQCAHVYAHKIVYLCASTRPHSLCLQFAEWVIDVMLLIIEPNTVMRMNCLFTLRCVGTPFICVSMPFIRRSWVVWVVHKSHESFMSRMPSESSMRRE